MRRPSRPSSGQKSTFQVNSRKEIPYIKWLDIFMERYGMSFEEFKHLPIPTFHALIGIIREEAEEQQKRMKK